MTAVARAAQVVVTAVPDLALASLPIADSAVGMTSVAGVLVPWEIRIAGKVAAAGTRRAEGRISARAAESPRAAETTDSLKGPAAAEGLLSMAASAMTVVLTHAVRAMTAVPISAMATVVSVLPARTAMTLLASVISKSEAACLVTGARLLRKASRARLGTASIAILTSSSQAVLPESRCALPTN